MAKYVTNFNVEGEIVKVRDPEIRTELNAEKAARQEADSNLATQISNEASTRQSAVSNLQTAISDEITARQTADSGLETAIESEAATREQAIATEGTVRANADTALNNAIVELRSAVGSPLVASNTSAMTDHDKIYVYTGSQTGYVNGNWYYWNGSAWTSGGVYNSVAVATDTTLTVSGKAADAKATGDAIIALNDCIASDFNTAISYKINDYCMYNGSLYRFINTHSGAWNSSHVEEVALANDVTKLAGVFWRAADMTAGGYTTFVEIPPGQYLVSLSAAGNYGFPTGVGASFYLHVSPKAYYGTGYSFKSFHCYSKNKAFFTVCGAASSPSNLPVWKEIVNSDSPMLVGTRANNDSLTTYGTFFDIPVGDYFVWLTNVGDFGFPTQVGATFYLEVSGSDTAHSTTALKTWKCFGNNGRAMFATAGGSSSGTNLPSWRLLDETSPYFTASSISSLGISSFVDIPQGHYSVNLSNSGDIGFPIALGKSFHLDVTDKPNAANNSFKTWFCYSQNGTSMYAMAGQSTTALNPPTWYYLSSNATTRSLGSVNKFSTPLDTVNLLLLGDSITQGSGATGLGGGVDFTTSLGTKQEWTEGNSWALKLEDYLSTEYPNITVTNHGWGGITLQQLATYIDEFVPANTTHCIIGLGVNSEGSTSFDGPIATIVNYLLEHDIEVFAWTSWLGSHPNQSNINTAGRVQAALIHAYRNVGIEPLTVYSIANRYLDENDLDFEDVMQYQPGGELVHPNDLGHTILYRIIREGFGF